MAGNPEIDADKNDLGYFLQSYRISRPHRPECKKKAGQVAPERQSTSGLPGPRPLRKDRRSVQISVGGGINVRRFSGDRAALKDLEIPWDFSDKPSRLP